MQDSLNIEQYLSSITSMNNKIFHKMNYRLNHFKFQFDEFKNLLILDLAVASIKSYSLTQLV